jgi:hypothetical protein
VETVGSIRFSVTRQDEKRRDVSLHLDATRFDMFSEEEESRMKEENVKSILQCRETKDGRRRGKAKEKLAKQQEDRQAQGHRKQKKKKRAVASIPLWTRVIASDVTLVARSLVVSFSCCSLYTYSMSNVWRTSKSRRKIDKTRGKKRKKKTSSESSRYK